MKNKRAVAMFGQKRLSREGGIEIVVKELCTRMARDGYKITCYNRSGHHVSGAEYDEKIEYKGICQTSCFAYREKCAELYKYAGLSEREIKKRSPSISDLYRFNACSIIGALWWDMDGCNNTTNRWNPAGNIK